MRALFLIARREYLSYVATWGFWLSLLAVPVFAAIGAGVPALIEGSQPVRYFAVIDETGRGLDQVIRDAQNAGRREAVRDNLEMMARTTGGDAAAQAALEAFDSDPDGLSGLDEALDAAGLTGAEAALAAGARSVMVSAPGATLEDLRPYLTGEATVDTPEGERALFAVFVLRPHETRSVAIDYLSANLTSTGLRSEITGHVREYLRRDALVNLGLSADEARGLLTLSPEVTTLDARPGAAADAEVTEADRAPFVIAVIMAFVLWMAVFSVANMLLTSLIEEKGGKIIEVLLSTARFQDILIGKLAGVAAVSMTLFAVWGLVGAGLAVFAGTMLAGVDPRLMEILLAIADPGLLLAAFVFFIAGYLMFGAIFLALGSLCDTLQDAQTLMGPVIWTLILPLLFLFFSLEASDSLVVRAASWVPLWTPFLMMARLPSEPPLWELLGSGALMVATTALVLWGAASVFRQGALRQADADSFKRWFRFGRKKS
ncbi:ABC transporter permease [Alkalicaulis satelles]|uniref:ABC transporter permease n=1 Tax=Alkalicaulis satelles TaxID=2609175 RepID=A0A5M6ZG80_9PROT|nr:ABC transporter permease [Alkalicaulis satelles]KAA5803756.1 ABC transporter permease [Alkalicaulis satelles]